MIGADPGAIAQNGTTYLLGGDELGRDLFARMIYGARVSLLVSGAAVAIGLVIGCVDLPGWPGWVTGLLFGALLSLPPAIITKAFAPILIIGTAGGIIIGEIIHGWH